MQVDWKSWILGLSGKLNGLWVALVSCLIPVGYIALTWTTVRTATPTPTQLLIDPGPRHLCYSFKDLARNASTASNRSTSECSLVPQYAGCPTWHYSSFNAGQDHEQLIRGGNGSLIDIIVVNNANGICSPVETSFDYLYPGCGIERSSNTTQFNLLEFDDWTFEYDIAMMAKEDQKKTDLRSRTESWNETKSQNLSTSAGPMCQTQNQVISTDFIYQWPAPGCSHAENCTLINSTISVVHYQSFPHLKEGPIQGNDSFKLRLIQSENIRPGSSSHVALNFKTLFQKYGSLLCHDEQYLPWIHVHTIRIVSTNTDTDSTINIQNVQASLGKGRTSTTTDWQPTYRTYDGMPKYCPGAPRSGDRGPGRRSIGRPFIG